VILNCSHQQIIPSANPDVYANSVIDSQKIPSQKGSLSDLLGPTSFPSGTGLRDVMLGGGWVLVDMVKNEEIIDGDGPDLRIYESGTKFNVDWRDDLYKVFVSNDNKTWHDLGYGRGIKSFDLAAKNLKEARYVKIKGYVERPSVTVGPEIEAIEGLHSRDNKQAKVFTSRLLHPSKIA
jgi:hypothetical protein